MIMAKDDGRRNVATRNGGIDRAATDLARQVAGLARPALDNDSELKA